MATTAQWMDVISNNLANIGTNGYKADNLAFADVMVNNMYANGGRGELLGTLGSGPQSVQSTVDRALGVIKPTGSPLDVAFRTKEGMFAVQRDGQTYYTRDGHFTLNSSGQLVTQDGNPVLDNRGSIIQSRGKELMVIDTMGGVRQGDNVIAQLGIYESDFQKVGNNLWAATDGNRPTPMTNPELITGSLESSNVEPVMAMVQLIDVQRSFEMSQKSIQSQDDMTGKLIGVLDH